MLQDNSVNSAVENADDWALARNPVYRNLQQKLIERTAERDVLRYVHGSSVLTHIHISFTFVRHANMGYRNRTAVDIPQHILLGGSFDQLLLQVTIDWVPG